MFLRVRLPGPPVKASVARRAVPVERAPAVAQVVPAAVAFAPAAFVAVHPDHSVVAALARPVVVVSVHLDEGAWALPVVVRPDPVAAVVRRDRAVVGARLDRPLDGGRERLGEVVGRPVLRRVLRPSREGACCAPFEVVF